MYFDLGMINRRALEDPAGFARECENAYDQKVLSAVEAIVQRSSSSRVVFLSGPSGSGKTTTAKKICAALLQSGVSAGTVSMDNYFKTINPDTAPRTEDGEIDHESPYCLDIELLLEHLMRLERGEEVIKPYFDFTTRSRDMAKAVPIKAPPGGILIFEGIHALNDILTSGNPDSLKLYISTHTGVEAGGVAFRRSWFRLLRRVVRDELFRGADASVTLGMWPNVRRGERLYIAPFRHKADVAIDSSMGYEIPVLKQFALRALRDVPEDRDPSGELFELLPVLREFTQIAPETVPPESILREFIGGGIYDY